MPKKIAVIGGGTGVFNVLTALKPHFKNLTAIVTMADDGGSTGILREEFGILPPGDIRRALLALSKSENQALKDLFSYRFQEGVGLTGHSFGNLIITALERLTDDFETAIEEAGKILMAEGKVVPVTRQHSQLLAKLENGQVIEGETNIDIPKHDGRLKIKKVWLKPAAKINPRARRAILEADLIIIGPGDLYTSLIPNLLVRGMEESLKKTDAKIVYFVNLMTKFGETNNFAASDFIKTIEEYLGKETVDYFIINNKRPSSRRLRGYVKEKADFVEPEVKNISFKKNQMPIGADLLRPGGLIRHDPQKLVKIIKMII